jgi:hypothetical protein
MRTHLGIKPFKCLPYDKQFNESDNLKAHYFKHKQHVNSHVHFVRKHSKQKDISKNMLISFINNLGK